MATPVISTTLHVDGTSVTGEAIVASQCSGGSLLASSIASAFPLSGTIANDGSFQAGNALATALLPSNFNFTLTGKSPLASSPSTWTGNYTLNVTIGPAVAPCTIAQSGSFTAAAIAPLSGTYVGVPTF